MEPMLHPLDWLDDALGDLDRRGLRRTLAVHDKGLVNFGSNDYLGLAADPRIAAAVRDAVDRYGWGSGASPLVTGRTELHAELERKLAEFEGTEAALLFPTGYAANVGTITALVGKGDAIYSDELNHASIIDGCRLSGAAIHVYPHRDLVRLDQLLSESPKVRRRLIVTDSLFSMTGDLAPLEGLTELAARHGCMLMVDEAHATGVFGARGRGVCEEAAVEHRVEIRVGTLSKALGSTGGFVAGAQRLIDWLTNRARPYVFSTAAPAAVAAAGFAALEIVRREPGKRQYVLSLGQYLRHQMRSIHIDYQSKFSQIVPVFLGEPNRALAASAELRRRGFFVPAIRPPSVPEGQSLLRISLTALHTKEQIDALVAALCEVAR
jgi:8-amino-7-oxononanoate synthase